ncbi:MAG: two pore domain potassium channel family protein [Saprospiraceae bacterium]|nr:two pore domain potassium channel family protein [Saprospiraceae bacterium]
MIFLHTIISFIKDKEYRDLLLTTFLVIFIGSAVYHYLEEWSWIDSVYFCVITLATVGYGDFAPQTDAGKIFTIFYIIIGVGIILTFINTVYNHYSSVKEKMQ